MKVTFWGTRGSIPCPGARYAHYGGNTSCLSIETPTGELVIDAGSGLREYGNARLGKTNEFHIALSHFHYDHIIGLPFFKPLWDKNSVIHIYCGISRTPEEIRTNLCAFFAEPFLPLRLADIPATLHFHPVAPGVTTEIFPGVQLSAFALEHPGGAAGYSLTAQERKFAYVSDHEGTSDSHTALVDQLHGYNLMVFDGFFCNENYQRGWGHSTWEYGIALAKAASIEKIAIFHHHVDHSDAQISAFENTAHADFPGAFFAKEGVTVSI